MVLAPKQEKPVAQHHKKRSAGHHKRTKPYDKTYWPYLPLLAIVGFTVLVNLAWPGMHAAQRSVLGTSTGISTQQLLVASNSGRANVQTQSLTLDRELTAAAQAKAQDMVARNYWSHTTPEGQEPWDFAKAVGYDYRALGENLAYGFDSPQSIIKGWLQSPEHRTNMLDPAYSEVGFGIVTSNNFNDTGRQTVVVALYGAPSDGTNASAATDSRMLPAKTVSRIDLLAGNGSPSLAGTLLIIGIAAAALFVIRHMRLLHKAVVYSEEFVVKHPHLDVLIVATCALAVLLTRSSGFIH